MPKITGTLTAISTSPLGAHTSTVERTGREAVTTTIVSDDGLKVVVTLSKYALEVTTFRLADGAKPDDADPIVWNEDASVLLVRDHATEITAPVEATVMPAEPLAF